MLINLSTLYFKNSDKQHEVEMLLLTVFLTYGNSNFVFIFLPQIEGAFIQGMGLYTIEELNYSPQGVLYTRGPDQYKIPAICDVPAELHISLLPPTQNSNTLYSSMVNR